ncbi:ABC transporter ATP-binding protein [Yanghanlia caeni]|uniref:Dipeptide ABC transporter ATP-binding protein n=1 Tax=Yanghanlia caeni TaxID=3064283 RepID=A0ABU1D5U0_9BURK|nr:dipeptide ABC transporter ATP-binding protein [Alcaligenaceae bacterium LG-2]
MMQRTAVDTQLDDRIAGAPSSVATPAALPAGERVLEVSGLSVAIDTEAGLHEAVSALNLAISAGETFALVGESGSGKSMTALAMLRLLPEAARMRTGRVCLGETDLARLPERDMRRVRGGEMGIIFQEPSTSLNPVLTIGQQIEETLRLHTPLRAAALRERAVHWLERVGIPEPQRRLDDYPFQFSGGQKQRIMIAMALAAEPRLLIADEPTTALDVTVQNQILDLLRDIQRELGLAILLITHDLAVVKKVAQHVALMRHGKIVETRDAASFFADPRHPYARELLAAIPSLERRKRPMVQPRGEPVLEVRDLTVRYMKRRSLLQRASGVEVLKGVSFALHAGETLALLGGSGCGKTTAAKALLGLLDGQAQVGGQIRLQGENVKGVRGAALKTMRRRVQIVFQDPYASLDPRMAVGEILAEGMAALRPEWSRAEREQRAAHMLEQVGLPGDALRRYPHEFSGGQRQRIAIARALAVEPSVLVCDEPTSALDVSVQAQILDLLHSLQESMQLACLFITHNFGVVEYMADRIAIMHEGRIVEDGPADRVLREPRHPQTQALLAAVPRL